MGNGAKKMQGVRIGDEIICSPFRGEQIVFPSKHHACRELGVTMKRLRRILDEELPVAYEGCQYWLDEMAVPRDEEDPDGELPQQP